MSERKRWFVTRVRMGWLLLVAGLALLAGSIAAAQANPNVDFNFRIVGGLGVAVGGVGVALLIRYGMALRSDTIARQVVVEERDERGVLIRQRAGVRAYWTSALLVFGGLMWTSFAANGQLAALQGDALWYFLAAAFVVPLLVYLGSVLVDERTI